MKHYSDDPLVQEAYEAGVREREIRRMTPPERAAYELGKGRERERIWNGLSQISAYEHQVGEGRFVFSCNDVRALVDHEKYRA